MGTLKYLFRKYFGNRYLKRLIQKRPPTQNPKINCFALNFENFVTLGK